MATVVSFTGTATKNTYVVGQSYTMNNKVYVARPDGTFQEKGSGRVLEGSSKSATAQFTYRADPVSAPRTTTKQGSGGAVPARVSSGTGPASAAAYTPSGPPSTMLRVPVAGPASVTTDLFINGFQVPVNPATSDAEMFEQRYGDGDFLSPTWFYQWAVFATDAPGLLVEGSAAAVRAVNDLATPDLGTPEYDTWLNTPRPSQGNPGARVPGSGYLTGGGF